MPRFRENRDNEIQGTESQVGFETDIEPTMIENEWN
jgi:hypothetical protein